MKIYVWYPLLASLGLGFTFMNFPPVNRQFMDLMGVGYDGLSWLLSGMFWSYAFGQIPAGFIADRCHPWTTMMAGLMICLLTNALPFLDPASLPLAVAMRFGLGVGASLGFMAMLKIILLLAPAERLASVQGFQGAAFSFGFVLPYLTLPHLGERAWPYAYILPFILIGAAAAAAFRLPRAQLAPARESRPAAEVRRALWGILTYKPIWFLGIFHGLSYGSLNNLGNWLPSMLADLDGSQSADWAVAAVAVLLLGTFGRAFGGRLLGFWSRGRGVNVAVLVIVILYLIMGLAGQKYALLGGALVMALACGSTYGGVFSLSAAAGAGYAATAMGVMNTVGNLVNVGLTLVFGYVRQYTGQFSPSLMAVGVLGLACWLAGRGLILRMDERK